MLTKELLQELDSGTFAILPKRVLNSLLSEKLDPNEIEGWVERVKRQMRSGILDNDEELVEIIIEEVDDKLFKGWGHILFMSTYNEIHELEVIDLDLALNYVRACSSVG